MTELFIRHIEGIGGYTLAGNKETGDVESITLTLIGQLESYRAAGQNKQSAIARHAVVKRDQSRWMQKVAATGVRKDLEHFQLQCAVNGWKLKIEAEVIRKGRMIRDYKNLVAGFDHMILDGLVGAGILLSDAMTNIDLSINQCWISKKSPSDALIRIRFSQSDMLCSKDMEKRARMIVLENGLYDRIKLTHTGLPAPTCVPTDGASLGVPSEKKGC